VGSLTREKPTSRLYPGPPRPLRTLPHSLAAVFPWSQKSVGWGRPPDTSVLSLKQMSHTRITCVENRPPGTARTQNLSWEARARGACPQLPLEQRRHFRCACRLHSHTPLPPRSSTQRHPASRQAQVMPPVTLTPLNARGDSCRLMYQLLGEQVAGTLLGMVFFGLLPPHITRQSRLRLT